VIHQQRKRKVLDIEDSIVTITTNKRRRQALCSNHSSDLTKKRIGTRQETEIDFFAQLVLMSMRSKSMVTISVNQGQLLLNSYSSMLPSVIASNILPRNSRIFQVAATGKVQDLLALLSDGKGSLHDRDAYGWPLLHHALPNPEMCKFLISKGMDVDELVFMPGNDEPNFERQRTPLQRAQDASLAQSFQFLLEAGADPTLSTIEWTSPLYLVSYGQEPLNHIMLRHIFTTSAHFDLSACRSQDGNSAFLVACEPYPPVNPKELIEKLAYLLDKGCNIKDRSRNGSNCLQVIFSCPWLHISGVENWIEVLIFLVRRGADVRARNNLGWSVSDMAYAPVCDQSACYNRSTSRRYGSYRGDMWDVVLVACGYSLGEFRASWPRKVTLDFEYSREHFEKLWHGREALCPYWYNRDEEWPPVKNPKCNAASSPPSSKICLCFPWRTSPETLDGDFCNARHAEPEELSDSDDSDSPGAAEEDLSDPRVATERGYLSEDDGVEKLLPWPHTSSDTGTSSGAMELDIESIMDHTTGSVAEGFSGSMSGTCSPLVEENLSTLLGERSGELAPFRRLFRQFSEEYPKESSEECSIM
jgi:ankyrin repeat protein